MNGIINELHRIKKILDDKGYHTLMVGLYGSQNYNLSDSDSDIDVRAIVLPSLESMIKQNKISKTVYYDNGQIDVKDVYSYYKIILKGNPAFTEPVQTKYVIGDFELIDKLKRFNDNPMAVFGTMIQKMKRYEKEKDPKDANNIIRLHDMFFSNERIGTYSGEKRKQMLDIKRGRTLVSDEKLSEFIDNVRYAVDGTDWGKNKPCDEEIVDYIKRKILEKIKKDGVL